MNPIFRLAVPVIGMALLSYVIYQHLHSTSVQTPSQPVSHTLFQYLKGERIQTLQLQMDLSYLYDTLRAEAYEEGILSWEKNGRRVELPVRTKARGKTRREVCDFPPIKLKVDSSFQLAGTLIREGKYKLITHCLDDLQYEDLLLREYTAFKIYEQLTEKGYQSLLFKINYLDKNGRYPAQTRYMVLLESTNELEERLAAVELEDAAPLKQVHRDQYNLFVLYQFMIGNTDWNLANRHNVKLLQQEGKAPFPVPYDFDFSGLVNAPYAKPYPTMPIQNVQDRFFQWRGKDRQTLEPLVHEFKTKRKQIIRQCDLLREEHPDAWEEMVTYLETFFQEIDQLMIQDDRLVYQYDLAAQAG